jgi:tetratricopeptide (TPR) repeat protein
MSRALQYYEQAISRYPHPPAGDAYGAYASAIRNSCDAYIQLGQTEQALELCSRILELEPDNAVNHYNMAGIHATLGRTDEAIASLRRDLELGDTDWRYLEADRWFDDLREDPRYRQIVQEMKRTGGDG